MRQDKIHASAVIVAAGQGTRMAGFGPKLFLELGGLPIVGHTWLRFDRSERIDEVVLVIRNEQEAAFQAIAGRVNPKKPYRFVGGGRERQDSVWNGLTSVSDRHEVVAIHDGARPCTPEDVIHSCIDAAWQEGAAVVASRVTDTIKASDDAIYLTQHLDRSRLWAVQTPQSFQVGVIREAFREAWAQGLHLTDDTAACDVIGQKVRIVENRHPNPKLTDAADLPYFELLLRQSAPSLDQG